MVVLVDAVFPTWTLMKNLYSNQSVRCNFSGLTSTLHMIQWVKQLVYKCDC